METLGNVQYSHGRVGKLLAALVGTLYSLYYASTSHDWHFIDNVDLIIHEAGHVIFSFFGTFIYILGGSLMQVAFPCVFVVYFAIRRNYFAASFILLWVGMSTINVSVYASDAIAQQLPLLGGDSTTHDWHAILNTLGLLPDTPLIGGAIYTLGLCTILLASFLSLYVASCIHTETIRADLS